MEIKSRQQYNHLRYFYALYFSGVGCFWPYIALFYKRLGYNGQEIGLFMAVGPLVLLVTQPLWGMVSDKTKSIPRLLSIATLMAVLIVLSFLFSSQPWQFLMLMALFNFFSYAIIPLADTLSMNFVNQHQLSFGRIRMWGSIGYCIVVVIVGQLATYPGFGNLYHFLHPHLSNTIIHELKGLPVFFMAYAVIIFTAFLVSFRLPPSTSHANENNPLLDNIIALLHNKRFVTFLFCVFLLQVTSCANLNYYSLYIDHLHGQTGLIGLAMTISAISETPVFLYSARIFRRFSALHLLAAAGFVGALRWYLCTLVSNPTMALWIQPAHAINFGCYYLGAVHFVDQETTREQKATGQTLFWSVGYGLAAITGNYLGGVIYNLWGIIILYRIGAGIALISGGLFYMMNKWSPSPAHHD